MSRYGYLPPPDPRTGKLQTKEGIERAIKEMQRFAGLKDTGKLGKCNAGNGLTAFFNKSFSVGFFSVCFPFLSAVYSPVSISKTNEIKTLCFQFFINTTVMKRFRVTFCSVGGL